MGKITPHPAIARGPRLRPPEPLTRHHDVSEFDCGKPDLNNWLVHYALRSEGRSARAYVVTADQRVVGYYCLVAGAVMRDQLPKSMRRNLPDQVPVIVLGRLAVDLKFKSRGFGQGLLKDALLHVKPIIVTLAHRASFLCRFGSVPRPRGG